MVIAGWSFVGAVLIIKDKESLKRFFLGLIILGLISTLFAIREYFSPNRPVGSVMVFGSDYLALGRIVSTSAIVLICSLVLKRMRFMTRMIGYVVFFSMLLAIVLSGARGPLLFLVLFIFLFIFGVFRFSKGYLFFFSMILIAIIFILNQKDLSVFDTLAVRISHAVNEQGGGDSIAGRVDRFDTAFNMISNRPLTGYGIDGFTQIYNDGRLEYPHNIFLEIASELGLVGIFLFAILVFVALFRYFTQLNKIQNGEEKILAWTLFLLFLYYFANANVSGSLLGNRVLFTLIALLTVFKGFITPKATQKENS
jgi:O-antigen ligase